MKVTTDKSILNQKSNPITKLDDMKTIMSQVNEMFKLMAESQGVGIAAPQVGIHKRFFLAVLDERKVELFINPIILNQSEEMIEDEEGCLSVLDQYGTVPRHKSITVKYFNGKEVKTETFEDLNARIIQHEYDHLDGILYTDKAINIVLKEAV